MIAKKTIDIAAEAKAEVKSASSTWTGILLVGAVVLGIVFVIIAALASSVAHRDMFGLVFVIAMIIAGIPTLIALTIAPVAIWYNMVQIRKLLERRNTAAIAAPDPVADEKPREAPTRTSSRYDHMTKDGRFEIG